MKTYKSFIMACCACIILMACSNDDDSNNSTNIGGTYILTQVTAPEAVDFNQDGTASFDLINESSCYNNSSIVLNADNTFTNTYNYVFISSNVECNAEVSTGTWESDGNTLYLTNTLLEPTSTVDLVIQGNTILQTLNNSPYPTRDENGTPIYANGMVLLTYTKSN